MTEPGRSPTPQRVLEMLRAFQTTSVVKAAIDLDLFTAVGEGAAEVPTLAVRLHASQRGVRALANYLVSLELLRCADGRYSLTEESARYLDRRSPRYLGGTAAFYASPTIVDAFSHAADAVRRGGSGAGEADSMAPDHPLWLDYARAMATVFARPAKAVAEHVAGEHPGAVRILDVGAGHGLFGIEIARQLPNARVTAIDWSRVLEIAVGNARSAGVGVRYTARAGDALTGDLGTGWDVVLLANFLHHFDPATCERFLQRVAGAMTPGGTIVVVEFVPNEDRVSPPDAAQFGMTMLTTTSHGDVFTFSELSSMLERAGFRTPVLLALPGTPQRAIFARR